MPKFSFDLSSVNGSNGFAINGIASNDGSGSFVSGAGDINGDGIDDVIIGAFAADPNGNVNAGQSYIVFGRSGIATLNLASLNGTNGFALSGAAGGNYSGVSVSGAGDVNGDGIDDLIVGANQADPNGNVNAGQSYVVFGRRSFSANLNLSDLDGSNGFTLSGIAANDSSGVSVSGAGDVNDDGIADLIVGANKADPNGKSLAGQSYVVFGRRNSASLSLAMLNGSNGFVINGNAAGDYSGNSVSGAGDVNGDGIDDLIVGAPLSDVNGNISAGRSYVVFGRRGGAASFEPATLNGSNGFVISGEAAGDYSGISVDKAGDINGDGIDDLIVGAYGARVNGNSRTGRSYVVFGQRNGTASLNLATLNGSNGFVINGIAGGDTSGTSVSGVGDMNGDGIDDLAIGASGSSANGNAAAGATYVVFGKRGSFTASLNLATLNGSNGFVVNGIAANDYSGISVSGAGDVDGDGMNDLIIGAALADPNGNGNAGQSYVLFGRVTGLELTAPSVDAAGVTIGSIAADLSRGSLAINRTASAIRKSVTGYRNVIGTPFNDVIIGSSANNLLVGNAGNDTLTGGAGNDRFLFDTGNRFNARSIGIDTITDFASRRDKLVVDQSTFQGLKRVSFATVNTVAQAQKSQSLLTYIRKTGALFYNQNGKAAGFGQGGQFADLQNGLNLTAKDLAIVP